MDVVLTVRLTMKKGGSKDDAFDFLENAIADKIEEKSYPVERVDVFDPEPDDGGE